MRLPLLYIAAAAIVAAQPTLRDALEWTAAQRGRMARMTNRVVDIHGTAGLARALCGSDPLTGSALYRDAIAFGILIVVLMIRPWGLLGVPQRVKV